MPTADPRRDHERRAHFWTRGLSDYLSCRAWIKRGEPGLAALCARDLARTMRRYFT